MLRCRTNCKYGKVAGETSRGGKHTNSESAGDEVHASRVPILELEDKFRLSETSTTDACGP